MAKAFDFSTLFAHADQIVARRAGEVVFGEGEEGRLMYVVKSGSVEIRVRGAVVEKVGPGGIVGEMALLDNSARSATVVAADDCELVPLDMRRFLFLVQQTPFFAIEVMRTMVRRLRAMDQRL